MTRAERTAVLQLVVPELARMHEMLLRHQALWEQFAAVVSESATQLQARLAKYQRELAELEKSGDSAGARTAGGEGGAS